MADEGKFEPGNENDVMQSVPAFGAGSVGTDADALRVRMTFTEEPPHPGEEPPRPALHELAFPWTDVLAVTNDSRDPRVILFSVVYEGEPRLLRFRPVQATQSILSDAQWLAANAFVDEDTGGMSVVPCVGQGCVFCADLNEELREHARQRPS